MVEQGTENPRVDGSIPSGGTIYANVALSLIHICKYVRVSLGGVRDESDIVGHRKTYVGAMPGRIISAIKQAGTKNPLLLLDEIDKLSHDFRGDPASALLEVLDSEQNATFYDHYIDMPFDLSDVMFITTANDYSAIPEPLADRMDVITLGSYTHEEKFQIATKHLIPKQFKKHGISSKQVRIQPAAVHALIDGYTREAGVRNLERQVAALCRKCAVKLVEDGEAKITIAAKDLEGLLGPAKFKNDDLHKTDEVGLVNGLAWTSVGGELLPIEVAAVSYTHLHRSAHPAAHRRAGRKAGSLHPMLYAGRHERYGAQRAGHRKGIKASGLPFLERTITIAVFAIADLHLSLGTDKPMDVFEGWQDYVQKLEKNWRAVVSEEDTVVIAGDISWAMRLEETEKDFARCV